MPPAPSSEPALPRKQKQVALKLQLGEPNFKWQMVFNAFWLEKQEYGVLVKSAYLVPNQPAEVLSVLVSNEGIQHLKESAKTYLGEFAGVAPAEAQTLPAGRYFTPMFSNHVRLARSGESAEIAFFVVPLHDIASVARGKVSGGASIKAGQVALLYSGIAVHSQLVIELIRLAK